MLKKLLAPLLAPLVLVGCALTPPLAQPRIATAVTAHAAVKPWTVLVHMAADNNLYEDSFNNLDEMEAGIDLATTNVIVLYDGAKKGDSCVYEIHRDPAGLDGHLISPSTNQVPFIPASHEINSSDPQTLAAFGQWAIAHYPAQHYALVIWDHGSGLFLPRTTPQLDRGFAWDDSSGVHMNTADLSVIAPALAHAAGKPLDLVGFDCCLMGHVEIGYQLKGSASYLVASQEVEPLQGWDYMHWLSALKAGTGAREASAIAVDTYGASYGPNGCHNPDHDQIGYTMAATDLNRLTDTLVPAIDRLGAALQAGLPGERGAIQAVRAATLHSFTNTDCADIGDFARLVGASGLDAAVKQAAAGVTEAIGASVVRDARGFSRENSHGLVVYFPTVDSLPRYRPRYDDPSYLTFANESWHLFTHAYANATR